MNSLNPQGTELNGLVQLCILGTIATNTATNHQQAQASGGMAFLRRLATQILKVYCLECLCCLYCLKLLILLQWCRCMTLNLTHKKKLTLLSLHGYTANIVSHQGRQPPPGQMSILHQVDQLMSVIHCFLALATNCRGTENWQLTTVFNCVFRISPVILNSLKWNLITDLKPGMFDPTVLNCVFRTSPVILNSLMWSLMTDLKSCVFDLICL